MKRPSFQFYPGDWLHDASLRMVSIGARGLWIDMICLMHQGSDYGFLKVNGKVILPSNLVRMCGATLHEIEGWLSELEEAGVFSKGEDGCIFSRRMIRDEEIREARAAGGSKGGNPNLIGKKKVNLKTNLKPTPSSSSSSSSSNKKITPAQKLLIDNGVSVELADAFLLVRKDKKAKSFSDIAFAGVKREAQVAGISVEQAITICVERNWTTFRSDWDWKTKNDTSSINGKPWYITASGIEAKAREHNINVEGRLVAEYKIEVYKAAGVTPEMVRKANADYAN